MEQEAVTPGEALYSNIAKNYQNLQCIITDTMVLCNYSATTVLIGLAKRAPQWGVQSRFRVIYIAYYTSKSGIWLVIS